MTQQQIDEVIRTACFANGVRQYDVLGPRRWRKLVAARIQIARDLRAAKLSYPEIGRILHRDHSTVISLVRGGKSKASPPAAATPDPTTTTTERPCTTR